MGHGSCVPRETVANDPVNPPFFNHRHHAIKTVAALFCTADAFISENLVLLDPVFLAVLFERADLGFQPEAESLELGLTPMLIGCAWVRRLRAKID